MYRPTITFHKLGSTSKGFGGKRPDIAPNLITESVFECVCAGGEEWVGHILYVGYVLRAPTT